MPGGGRHGIPRFVYAHCSATRSLRLVLTEADVRLASSPPPRSLLYPRSMGGTCARDRYPANARRCSSWPLPLRLLCTLPCLPDIRVRWRRRVAMDVHA
jgi:hypothetical protein